MEAQNSAGQKLGQSFLAGQNCKVAHCYMKIRLANTLSSTLGVKIVSNKTIPDINGILIADGLSQNALYHARIIELLPVTQSI